MQARGTVRNVLQEPTVLPPARPHAVLVLRVPIPQRLLRHRVLSAALDISIYKPAQRLVQVVSPELSVRAPVVHSALYAPSVHSA